jgi:hypothetical protein
MLDTEQAAEAIMVNMSEDWRRVLLRKFLMKQKVLMDKLQKHTQKMGDLANKRRNTPASEYSERGEKRKN